MPEKEEPVTSAEIDLTVHNRSASSIYFSRLYVSELNEKKKTLW